MGTDPVSPQSPSSRPRIPIIQGKKLRLEGENRELHALVPHPFHARHWVSFNPQ